MIKGYINKFYLTDFDFNLLQFRFKSGLKAHLFYLLLLDLVWELVGFKLYISVMILVARVLYNSINELLNE